MATGNQRRDAARRKLEAELAQRQAQQTHRRSRVLTFSIAGSIAAAILVVILVAVLISGGDDKKKTASASPSPSPASTPSSSPETTPTPKATTAPPGACDFSSSGAAAKAVKAPPSTGNTTTGAANVTFKTTQGTFVMQVDRALAPCTVDSFLSLASQKYFDATSCHRLTTSGIYVLQCGDPTASGSGGPGYTVPDEMTGKETYPAGTLAMANTGQPHSGGSQFFIVTQDSSQGLGSGKYTVFGKVTAGMDVLAKVAAAGVVDGSSDGKPKLPVTIESATIS